MKELFEKEFLKALKCGNIFEMIRQKKLSKKRKEFLAKLKYGEDWYHELYPNKYTQGSGPR